MLQYAEKKAQDIDHNTHHDETTQNVMIKLQFKQLADFVVTKMTDQYLNILNPLTICGFAYQIIHKTTCINNP